MKWSGLGVRFGNCPAASGPSPDSPTSPDSPRMLRRPPPISPSRNPGTNRRARRHRHRRPRRAGVSSKLNCASSSRAWQSPRRGRAMACSSWPSLPPVHPMKLTRCGCTAPRQSRTQNPPPGRAPQPRSAPRRHRAAAWHNLSFLSSSDLIASPFFHPSAAFPA